MQSLWGEPARRSYGTRFRSVFSTPVIVLAFLFFAAGLTAYAAFGDGAPTSLNSGIFTDQSSTLRVDGSTGAFTQKVPILVPPGRNGLQPDVSLDYNSQRTEDSIVGYGWSLSTPYIQRMNKTGSQDLYATSTTYLSSMDGELVQVSSSTAITHRARVDTGSFNSYSFANNQWTVYDKKGTKYLFGSDTSGRQYDTSTGTSTQTYKWMLQEVRDTNNNYITYTYLKDNNEIYPYQITYTGNNVTAGSFGVSFATSTRSDTRESYKAGFKITTRYRISQITTTISGTTVGSYALTYGTGVNNVRSLLTSVQRTGYDESASGITLPAMTFTYASSSVNFISHSDTSGGGLSIAGSSFVVADVNGNGINDVTESHYSIDDIPPLAHAQIYLDQGGYSQWNQTASLPEFWSYQNYQFLLWPSEAGVRYLDANGDGKVDVLRGNKNDQAGTRAASQYLGNGDQTWTSTTTFTGTIPAFGYVTSGGTALTTGLFGDVNGDGLPDFVMALNAYTGDYTYLGNQSAYATSTAFTPAMEMPSSAGAVGNASQLVDINGDGLDDWLYSDDTQTYVRLNTGSGWAGSVSSQWTIATSTYYHSTLGADSQYYDRGVRFQDVNGDGLPDFIRGYSVTANTNCSGTAPPEYASFSYVALNTGNGWATSTAYSVGSIVNGWLNGSGSPCGALALNHNEYANWVNGQTLQNVITGVTMPTGGYKSIIYTPSASLGTNTNLPISLLAVTEVGEYDGFGTAATTTYSYSGGKLYTSGGAGDRKFGGFAVATTTNSNSVVGTYYSQGDGINTSLGEQTDGFAQINRPYRTDIFDPSGNIIQRTLTKWDTNTASSSIFVAPSREVTFSYGPGVLHRDKATTYAYATTTRDLISSVEYGEVTGSSDGSFTDVGTDKRTTTLAYVASSSVNMSQPKQKTLFDNSSATTTDERYYYDSLALGSVTKGNQTKVERLKSGSTYVNDQKAYNSYGLVASSTDPRGNVTSYIYDSRNLYVATSTNALSQSTQFYYDYTLGKPKQTIDPNTRVFTTTYDGLDRPVTESQPDLASPGSLVTKKTYAYTDTVGSRSVLETNNLDGSTSWLKYTYLDGLDRTLQTRKEAEDTNNFSVRDFIYDTAGLLRRESLPYFSLNTARTSATTTNALFTLYTYDPLKRVTALATVVGTTTTTFAGWTATTTDALSNNKGLGYDAYKRLATVTETNAGAYYTTNYTYDAADNLTKVTDASANIRNFTYDNLKRRTAAEDLHAVADGTFGTWSYVYDDASNLASTTDPKSQVVNYTYDALNRQLTEDYTGAAGTEVSYAYDACTEGVGRLCTATSTNALSKYTYNALGLAATEAKTIASTTYTNTYTYNRQGNMTNLVYPDNSEVQYTYNTAGLLETIQQKESGGSFANVATDFDYAPTEKVSFKALANNVKTSYTYDANELYRLRRISTIASTTWDGVGGAFALGGKNMMRMFAKAQTPYPLALLDLVDPAASTTPDVPVIEEIVATTTEEIAPVVETLVVATTTAEIVPDSVKADIATSSAKASIDPALLVPYSTELVQNDETLGKAKIEFSKTKPEVRLEKWGGELGVTVTYTKLTASSSVDSSATKSVWGTGTEEVHAYPLAAKDGMEGGGAEIEVVLNQKPDTNVFNFAISGAENLDFFYQPELTDEELKAGDVRPDNVIGSYAVYYKEKKNYREGEVNYATGKAFHIFRPDIVDAKGTHVWGTLVYSKGTLSVMVPQEFLDSAAYPVTVDPTFGYTVAGATTANLTQDAATAIKYTLPDANATVQKISLYEKVSTSGTRNIKGLIYSNSGTYPNTLLGTTTAVAISNTSAAWQDLNFTSPVSLASSGTYWLGFVGDTGSPTQQYFYDTGSVNQHYARSAGSGDYATPPSTYAAGATGSAKIVSMYATYAAAGSGTNTYSVDLEKDSSQYLVIDDASQTGLDLTTHTIEAWIKPETFAADGLASAIVSKWNTSTNNRSYQLAVETTGGGTIERLKLTLSSDGGGANIQYKTSNTTLPAAGNWVHVAATWSAAGGIVLYIDGVDAGSNDAAGSISSVFNSNASTTIGVANLGGTPNSYYDGKVDDVRVWNTVRSASDISANKSTEMLGSESGLVAYWKLNNAATDLTSNHNNLTLVNSPVYSTDVPFTGALPSISSYAGLQNLTYTYDAVGNILTIIDRSQTLGAATTTYAYDSLYRLTSAVTTQASSTPYSDTYAYDALGNITSKTNVGSYSYAGTGYANPHAATSINGVALSYDRDGNLQNYASTTNAWDYKNRLTSSFASSTPTVSYWYDQGMTRVLKGNGTASTTYLSMYFNTQGATSTIVKQIYTPSGDLIATITGGGTTSGGSSTSTPAYVQSKKDSATGAVTLTSSVTTGNLIVVGLTIWNTTVPSNAISDNKGNTYTKITEAINAGTTDHAALFYAKNVTGGSSFTITSSIGGTLAAMEYSGVSTTTALDTSNTATGSSNRPQSGSITTTNANELYVGLAWSQGNGDTWGSTNGYTLRENETNNSTAERIATSDQIIAATTTKAVFTTTTADQWAGVIAAFKPQTTGGSGTTSSTTITYIHQDHLGSTNVITDTTGAIVQTLSYYPYGQDRINIGSTQAQKTYIQGYRDSETKLSYLQNRYLSPLNGQFMSEDPTFWGTQNLGNPQSLNSYSYAEGNPINKKDPDGKEAYVAARPVTPQVGPIPGTFHLYYYISPDQGSRFSGIGPFTLGGGPQNTFPWGNLSANFGVGSSNGDSRVGLPSDSNFYQRLTPAKGQTEDDLIAGLYQGNVAVGGVGVKYDPSGGSFGGRNSNSYARTLAQFGGVSSQFSSFASKFNAPGSGNSVLTVSAGSLGIGNTQGNFVGTYDFGSATGTYNFGTQSWSSSSKTK